MTDPAQRETVCPKCEDGWLPTTEIYADGSYATCRRCPKCHGTGRVPTQETE